MSETRQAARRLPADQGRDEIRRGREAGANPADRDANAELWVFEAGLRSVANRPGGVPGASDLEATSRERVCWHPVRSARGSLPSEADVSQSLGIANGSPLTVNVLVSGTGWTTRFSAKHSRFASQALR